MYTQPNTGACMFRIHLDVAEKCLSRNEKSNIIGSGGRNKKSLMK